MFLGFLDEQHGSNEPYNHCWDQGAAERGSGRKGRGDYFRSGREREMIVFIRSWNNEKWTWSEIFHQGVSGVHPEALPHERSGCQKDLWGSFSDPTKAPDCQTGRFEKVPRIKDLEGPQYELPDQEKRPNGDRRGPGFLHVPLSVIHRRVPGQYQEHLFWRIPIHRKSGNHSKRYRSLTIINNCFMSN